MISTYKVIGLMSGTSLDGLDIVGVFLIYDGASWSFEIKFCGSKPYPEELRNSLKSAIHKSGEELLLLDHELGNLFGSSTLEFIEEHNFKADFISSHGHTVYHQPQRKITMQIGSANCIYALTGIPVVCDFRSLDVQLGGQGAPLVPVGDHYLFPQFDACLNLGGISNVSFSENNARKAFDISVFNIAFNHFAQLEGLDFDADGKMAKKGSVNKMLLEYLNELSYYSLSPPKSLGFEQIEKEILMPTRKFKLSNSDTLRTFGEHLANKISDTLRFLPSVNNVLITGGGAHNSFFIELLKSKLSNIEIILPEKDIIDFKEAIVFALLGTLRVRGEENVFKSVTGAKTNSCSGSIIGKLDERLIKKV